MALTLGKFTTAGNIASTFFSKFVRQKPSFPATFSPLIKPRYSSSTTNKNPESDRETSENPGNKNDPPVLIQGSPQDFKMENPFQSGGPNAVIRMDKVKDGLLVRITLPGVGEDGCKVWVENNSVFFAGDGEVEFEGENSGRSYGGSLKFRPEFHKLEEVKSDMRHGILRLTIPKVGGFER